MNIFKKIQYSEKENEKRCPITLEDFTIGGNISKLQCGHIFNSEAIIKWLEMGRHECPLCRFDIHTEEDGVLIFLREKLKKVSSFIGWFFDEAEPLWSIMHP